MPAMVAAWPARERVPVVGTTLAPMTEPRPLTLMTVHAHPDDETIGTGGTMARAVADGHRVVLVTCTRGELGEIVVPDMDTPDNHRRLGEIRAGELERAMGHLGVTEWDNLGYRDSGMMGTAGQPRPAGVLAGRPRRGDRPVGLAGPDAIGRTSSRPTTRSVATATPTTSGPISSAVGAFERAGDPASYPGQLAPEHGGTGPAEADGGLAPWAPSKLYEQALSRSLREAMNEALAEMGERSFWMPPEDATPEQLAEFEAFTEKMLVPDEAITTRVDVGPYVEAKWAAIHEHVTQISDQSPFMLFGLDGWRRWWSVETYILRESRIPTTTPETDLFAGLD